jgi:hypothetical protein
VEALSSTETSVLQEPHGVTSKKTPFFISVLDLIKYMALTISSVGDMYNT